MSTFTTLEEGWVIRFDAAKPGQAAGSRCAVTRAGDVICTYMAQSKIAVNDFRPMLARSRDGGVRWHDHQPIWPHLAEDWSIYVSVSRAPDGQLLLFGNRCPIDEPGELFWSDATQGLKQNELVWSSSCDDGHTWQEPHVIPMPVPGAAEAPGAMCITRRGRWLGCYSPYNTFDAELAVDRSKVLVLASDDRGETWQHSAMLSFSEPRSGGAEAWVVELSDGRLLGAAWQLHLDDQQDYPNPFAVSHDGLVWQPTRSTGTMGQSVGLAAAADGRVLMTYNQRKHGEVGVWLARARPTDEDFGLEANQIVWRAGLATRGGTSGDHSQWTDFAFGEPAVTVLDDETFLIVMWVNQPDGQGVRYVRLRMNRE